MDVSERLDSGTVCTCGEVWNQPLLTPRMLFFSLDAFKIFFSSLVVSCLPKMYLRVVMI